MTDVLVHTEGAHGAVRVLRLNRPQHENQITTAMAQSLTAELTAARDDPAVRGVVLAGAGSSFCTGGQFWSPGGSGDAFEAQSAYSRAGNAMFTAMAGLDKPLLAAVNGDALAGGFALVGACDLAWAVPGAHFGMPEVTRDFFPFLATSVLYDLLPRKVFFELAYGGRPVDAERALALDLLNGIADDPLATAVAFVDAMPAANPRAIAIGRNLYSGIRGLPPAQGLQQGELAVLLALQQLNSGT